MSSDAFNNTTTAQEVANAFKDRIQGKNGMFRPSPLQFEISRIGFGRRFLN